MLAQMGYSPSTLNQFAVEVEGELVQLAQRHGVLAQKYAATEFIMSNPEILANYVVDFERHVQPGFLSMVADYAEQAAAMTAGQQASVQAQGQPPAQAAPQQTFMGNPLGSSMITPEMLQSHERVIPSGMGAVGQPWLAQGPQAAAMVQAQQSAAQYPLQPMNPGVRVDTPGMPVSAGNVSSGDVWNHLRQQYARNPAMGYLIADQMASHYGPAALAKELISI